MDSIHTVCIIFSSSSATADVLNTSSDKENENSIQKHTLLTCLLGQRLQEEPLKTWTTGNVQTQNVVFLSWSMLHPSNTIINNRKQLESLVVLKQWTDHTHIHTQDYWPICCLPLVNELLL